MGLGEVGKDGVGGWDSGMGCGVVWYMWCGVMWVISVGSCTE